jgi:hypothetical protein
MKDNEVVKGTHIQKTVEMNKREIVEYQLVHYCTVNDIQINHTEIKLLALLGELGKIRLVDFGKKAVSRHILSSVQAVNTAVQKLYRTNLYVKEGIGKKLIYLNPSLQIHAEGNIVLQITLIKRDETKKSSGSVQAHGRKVGVAAGVH